MKRTQRFPFAAGLAIGLPVLASALAQTPAAPGPEGLQPVLGVWALHPIEADAEPPPPPPIYASYRKNEPPLEKISRVAFENADGQLRGTAVFAKGIVTGGDGGDVEGRPEVVLKEVSFADGKLRFEAIVDGEAFEAEADLQGPRNDRFEGTWKAGQRQGRLFLNRRK